MKRQMCILLELSTVGGVFGYHFFKKVLGIVVFEEGEKMRNRKLKD